MADASEPKPEPEEPWITASEAARILGVSRKTLHVWTTRGDGPAHHRLGGIRRYRASDVLAYLAATRVEARPAT